MKYTLFSFVRYLLLPLPLFLLGALPPAPSSGKVHDFANVLDYSTTTELSDLAHRVEEATGAELALVTVSSLDGETVDSYANTLANSWGIGKRDLNNGVLFLVAPNERRVRIEVGYGLEPLLTDSLCGEILDTEVIPRFRDGDLPAGVRAGVTQIAQILLNNPEAARGIPGSTPLFVRTPRRDVLTLTTGTIIVAVMIWLAGWILSRRESFPTWFFSLILFSLTGLVILSITKFLALPDVQRPLGMAGGALGSVCLALYTSVRRYFRFGPHHCSRCSSRLTLIGESEDNQKLSEVQQLEEKLGSVDYDVWYCPSCLNTDTERYVSFWSNFKDCPGCRHRTLKETSITLVSATEHSTGKRQVTGDCVSCKHHSTRTEIIPRVSKSSSSGGSGGGGGFGGGSSGGGGSSRGW